MQQPTLTRTLVKVDKQRPWPYNFKSALPTSTKQSQISCHNYVNVIIWDFRVTKPMCKIMSSMEYAKRLF